MIIISKATAKAIFNAQWRMTRSALASFPQTAALVSRLPKKADVWRCMASKAVADSDTHWNKIEQMGGWVFLINFMADNCEHKGEAAAMRILLESRNIT